MLNNEVFVKRAKAIHGDKYDYSMVRYTGVRNKVTILCPEHGEFNQSYELHVRRKSGCNECGIQRQRESKKITPREFLDRANNIHNGKYTYPKLELELKNGLHSKITIVCPKHGTMLKAAYSHLHDKRGCALCANEEHRLTTDQFINKSKGIFGNFFKYTGTKYKTVNDFVQITCPHHGIFSIPPKRHYEIGCYKCKKNRLEDKWLDSIGIPNDGTSRQVRLTVANRIMVVDGYNSKTNTVYLFHGDFWHGNPTVYNPNDLNPKSNILFGMLYENTIKYEKTLRDHGYHVVSMWEFDFLITNKNNIYNKKK